MSEANTPAPAPASAAAKPAKMELKGDARTGMSFWNTGVFVTATASDIAKPVAPFAIWFFVLFAIATGAAAYFTFVRKPSMPLARTALGTAGLGTALFGFFILAPMFAPAGNERGLIAAVAPPVAAVQTAILPLTPTEKELLTLTTRITSGEAEARSAAARAALTETKDQPTRRAMLERILRNGDANIRQAGIVQALKDRGRAALVLLPDRAAQGPLAAFLTGLRIELYSVNVATGALSGQAHSAGGARGFNGTAANGRLVVTTVYLDAQKQWQTGLTLDLTINDALQLVGDARTPQGDAVKVEVPLL